MSFAEGTPTVEITLGGKPYTLGWTWGAKRRAREAVLSRYADPLNVDQTEAMAAAVWASLDKEAREALSLEDVEELINPRNETEIMQKVNGLVKASEPEPDPNVKPPAVKEPTGGKSNSNKSGQLASTISA